jgi:general secretion pathway protein I
MKRTGTPPCSQGFTLIEVLVALAITSIALMAGWRAIAQLTQNSQRLLHVQLAQLCADNALGQTRLSAQWPGVGTSQSACKQAHVDMTVLMTVQATPNPNFRRIDVQVSDAVSAHVLVNVSTILGRF